MIILVTAAQLWSGVLVAAIILAGLAILLALVRDLGVPLRTPALALRRRDRDGRLKTAHLQNAQTNTAQTDPTKEPHV